MEKEKPAKSKKNIILKFLPKAAAAAASAVTFQNHPFSPGREKRFHHHHHNHKGFSGPIISIIPAEARNRKSNNETNQEPTSPKVSCIGQIKQRKKKKKIIKTPVVLLEKIPSKKKSSRSNFRNLFQRGRKSDAADDISISSSHVLQNRAPCLNHMKKFASGREGNLSNFDWKNVQITPEDHRKYYSDDDREDYCDEVDEEEEEVIIPFSAPILVGRDSRPNFPLEPKKEINLWKRRTMTKPNPLQLKK